MRWLLTGSELMMCDVLPLLVIRDGWFTDLPQGTGQPLEDKTWGLLRLPQGPNQSLQDKLQHLSPTRCVHDNGVAGIRDDRIMWMISSLYDETVGTCDHVGPEKGRRHEKESSAMMKISPNG